MTGDLPSASATDICRFCGGPAKFIFDTRLLRRYQVRYFRCEICESLQTEWPYWLEEAYSDSGPARQDTGAALRNIDCFSIAYWVARVLKLPRGASALDFGGGSGLLCRLLRDTGFDARVLDAYATNHFALGFEDLGGPVDLLCSFEVFEHLTDPSEAIAPLLKRVRKLAVISTATYTGQGADWWYLSAASGQHVFFYSQKAMEMIARQHGFSYLRNGDIHIFTQTPPTGFQAKILDLLLRRYFKYARAVACLKLNYDVAISDSRLF